MRSTLESAGGVSIAPLPPIKSNLRRVIGYFRSVEVDRSTSTGRSDWNGVCHGEVFDATTETYTLRYFESLTADFDWVELPDARLGVGGNLRLHLMPTLKPATLSLPRALQPNRGGKRLFACNDEEGWVCLFYGHLHFPPSSHSPFSFIPTLSNPFIPLTQCKQFWTTPCFVTMP